MADLESLKTRLDKLNEIRAKGLTSYTIKDRTMTYRSDRELATAIADLETKIASLQGGAVRKVRIRSGKGLT